MTTQMQEFFDICKEQIKWQKEYYKDDSSDYKICNCWKKIPLKLIPEVDSDIIHFFSDKNCTSKCNRSSPEDELGDGFSDYLISSDIVVYGQWDTCNINGVRGDWEICGCEMSGYFENDRNGIYVKVNKGSDPYMDAWVEYVLND